MAHQRRLLAKYYNNVRRPLLLVWCVAKKWKLLIFIQHAGRLGNIKCCGYPNWGECLWGFQKNIMHKSRSCLIGSNNNFRWTYLVPSDIIIYAMYSFNWTKNRSVQILIGMQEDGRQQDEWPCHASGHAF